MSSKRRHEGYLQIDHRESPGVSAELAAASGKRFEDTRATPVGKSTLFESSTITCSHCQRVVALHPHRTRERGYCKKCDHYICDGCATVLAQTRECVPFQKILDDAQENAFRDEQRGAAPNILLST